MTEKTVKFTLDDINTLIQDIEKNGGRVLTAEQEEFFKKNDIALEYVNNNDSLIYLVIPAESQLLMEEQMSGIVAAEGGPAGTTASAGSAGSAGSFFCVFGFSTGSSLGTVGTAGTLGSVNACAGGQTPATEEEQAKSDAFAGIVSNRINS